MTAALIAVGVVSAALVFAFVQQRLRYRAELNVTAMQLSVAGDRIRELAREIAAAREATHEQIAILESDIAELEKYIADSCSDADRLRYYASVQSLRDTAARLADLRDREAADAGKVRPGDQE